MIDRAARLRRARFDALALALVLDDQNDIVDWVSLFRDEGRIGEDEKKKCETEAAKTSAAGAAIESEGHEERGGHGKDNDQGPGNNRRPGYRVRGHWPSLSRMKGT